MIITTVFQRERGFELGEVEVHLQPGLPQLLIVGLPDAAMRECAVKIKSALRACGREWPSGHQIVVNLRPSYERKSSAGVDLAIALAILAQTGQLSDELLAVLETAVVYGEVALDGRVFAPKDVGRALRAVGERRLLTGVVEAQVRDGRWTELVDLRALAPVDRERMFDWDSFWRAPEIPDIDLHEDAARALVLAAHMDLNVLVAGPQGSGKTTWARALFALSRPPSLADALARADLFGEDELEARWRPCEQPHHTTPALSMIGGGFPLQAGVISRAHGGFLVLDEFLEFAPGVLEALREPVESGVVELARRGTRERLPARFQLVATTNLCPCGKLDPERLKEYRCAQSLLRCRAVSERLSGPLLDRFDIMVFSHKWLKKGSWRPLRSLPDEIARAAEFALKRGPAPTRLPSHWAELTDISHRRRHSMLRVARGLADLDQSLKIRETHWEEASRRVIAPGQHLRELFA